MKKQQILNRNEIVQGPSPKVRNALKKFDHRKAPFYFEGYHGSSLAPKLSKKFGVAQDQISIGYGIEFFLRAIFDGLDPGTETLLMHEHHYSYYSLYTAARGLNVVDFKMKDLGTRFEFDIEDCIKKIKAAKPKVVLITSPNISTGNSISAADLSRILKAAGKKTLVVLDEAYYGFDKKYEQKKFFALLAKHENLVILRSFSKRYALAGFRIGFALWGKNAKKLIRYEDLHLGGSRLLEEVALAALESEAYYDELIENILSDRDHFIKHTNRLNNFKAYDQKANFVIVKVQPKAIPLVKKKMEQMPILIGKFIMPEFMRVSTGLPKTTAPFLKALQEIDREAN